jgi:serine protease Do
MDISSLLTDELSAAIQLIQRSLVVIQDGNRYAPRGMGAGVVWQRGLILTNHHIVKHAHTLGVSLPDGREFSARLVAGDSALDLALLKIDDDRTPPAMIADSRGLRVGQYVMAIGHPWGERGLVTGGMISGLGTLGEGKRYSPIEIIRTDVRLAPGSSGGPLVNASGAVIGLNTMIVGGDLGVAVPSHVASAFVQQVLTPTRDLRPGKRRWNSHHQIDQTDVRRML